MGLRISAAMCAAGRTLGDARLSPDGSLVAFVASDGGGARLVVVDAAGGPERVLSSDPAPGRARSGGSGLLDWCPEGDALLHLGADGGVWRQRAAGGPAIRVHEGAVDAIAAGPAGTWAAVVDTRIVVVGDGDGRTHELGGQDFALDPVLSPDGAWVAWQAWDDPSMPWDDARVVLAPADGSAPPVVIAGGSTSAAQQPRFSPDGTRLALLVDDGGWLNLTVVDVATRAGVAHLAEHHEHGGPTWGPGQRSFAWSPDSSSLAFTRNDGGYSTLEVWVVGQESTRTLGRGIHTCVSWAGDRVAAVRSGARTPTQVAVYDAATARRSVLAVGPVVGFDRGVEPEVVSWRADDGTEIPARLYRAPESHGLIVWVHGGPTDQWQVEFRPRADFWLERGWSILVPDHRGSTGHGRAFAQALRGGWGVHDVADVAAGARIALAEGWAEPGRLVAMGASAGGFTVLNLLARYPGVFAAGISLYGIADLATMETHRFEAHYTEALVGPLPAAAEAYRERSPLHQADRIVDPLLLLHGDADVVVPVAQSRAMAERLGALGRPVELHVYEGEGHGWGRPEVVIDELERVQRFLAVHVEGAAG